MLLAVLLLTSATALAQSGLSVNGAFGGRYKQRSDVSEVLLRGKEAKAYGMTLFRSLKAPGTSAIAAEIEEMVRRDGKGAVSRSEGAKGGHLYYAFYELRPLSAAQRRYIFFRNNATAGKKDGTMTLIYIEGPITKAQIGQKFGK